MVEFIWLIRFMLKFTAQELVNWSARVNQSLNVIRKIIKI